MTTRYIRWQSSLRIPTLIYIYEIILFSGSRNNVIFDNNHLFLESYDLFSNIYHKCYHKCYICIKSSIEMWGNVFLKLSQHIYGVGQDCGNSSAIAMELPQICTK